jgi:hypothetical protein
MEVKINEIYSKKMFAGLIMGAPKEGMYEKSLDEIKHFLGDSNPITNLSKTKWLSIKESTENKMGYGSWGHITGVKLTISEEFDNYDFSLIFNFHPELEKLEDVINKSIDLVDWRNNSFKWDAGDL